MVLGRFANQSDVVIGTPSDNRHNAQVQDMIGFFVNSLPIRLQLDDESSMAQLIEQSHQQVAAAKVNQDIPFEQMVHALGLERDLSRHPIFQVLFSLQQNNAEKANWALPLTPLDEQTQSQAYSPAKFDLTLIMSEGEEGLKATFNYATSLFEKASIERIAKAYHHVLKQVAQCTLTCLKEYALLSAQDNERLLEWAKSDVDFIRAQADSEHSLVDAFEAQVAACPQAIALTCGQQQLSYQALNERANQLANWLRASYQAHYGQPLAANTLIALYVEPSLELMISVLAVLKAGAAYVPMAPSNPALRNQHVLDDSAPTLVLTTAQSQSAYQTQLNSEAPLLVMDDDSVSACATTTPDVMHGADDLAYVIYTSGTTGKAKGVLQNHANVMRLFKATAADYQFNAQDVWMLYHAYTFDFTVWEMWGALLHGGRLVIPEQSLVRDFAAVAKLCQQEAVTVLNQTPGAFLGFAEAALTLELDFPALRYVIFGGDKLNPASLKRWWARFGDSQPQLVNMYGITETTVHTTYQPLYAEHASECSTIGRVLRDMQAYVLNEQMQLVPPGVPGELYIGGAGLSPGYLNRPELTAERFIDNPFADESMQALGYTRMYKTGDVVRWLADGTLEYLGRNDNQVKIRGYRIELGEIEAALLQQDGVQQAALLIDDSEGHARLLAYVVSDDAQLGATLKGALAHVLPSYMIPAHITVLAQLPLTVNGKLDRAALPRPSQVEARTYIAPSTKTEQILCSVWQEVLQVEQVGVNDNYYELGGDSIISIKLVTRARQAGVEFSLADLLATQTVSLLAQCVDAGEAKVQQTVASSAFSLISEADKALLPEGIEDAYPVSRLQLGMLFHTQSNDSCLYHDLISYPFTLPLDESCLRDTLAAICARHSILRTQIALSGFSKPLQLVHEQAQIELFIGNTDEDLQAVHAWYKQEHQRGFADNEYPLLRVAAHRIDAERFHLSFSVHHAIIDGWSEAALTAEVAALYGKALAGKSLVQPALAASYRDFIAQEQAALSDTDNHTFWRNQFEQVAAQPVLLAPSDDDSLPSHTAPESDYLMFSFNATQAKALQALAARCDVSLKAVMFAAHSKALSLATGYEQVVSGLSVHGRPEVLDSDKLLGLFVNILPVTVSCQVGSRRTGSWLEFIQAVHGQMNAVEAQRFFPLEVVKELVGDEPFHAAFNYTSFNAYWQQDSVAAEDLLAGRMGIAENSLPLSLNVQTSQNTDEIMCSLSTLRSHYKAGVGVSYAKLYQRIIEMMLQDATASHHQVLEEAEQYQQLVQWNGHTVSFGEQTITELFEQHAARTPDAVALITQEKTYSYGELNAMANRRAAMILANVAGKPQMIGVYHSSRLDMVLSMLAALKVGAAYVPFAMGTPASRVSYIVDDCQLDIMLCDSHSEKVLTQGLASATSNPVCLYVDKEDAHQFSAQNIAQHTTLNDLAYIMYTSGTTGQPKGAMIPHRGVVSLVNNTDYVDITTQDVFVQLANPAFDAATFEIWGALTQGASLVVPNDDMMLDAESICDVLTRHHVSILWLTRALFDSVYSESTTMFAGLRYLLVGGEALTSAIMARLVSQVERPVHILNGYGPTESTTFATTHECQGEVGSVPIGKPINGRQVYVLSPSRTLLPTGCVGELYIGGAGLAQGYLNKPTLTEQAFIRGSEFQIAGIEPDAVLYKTGDKVRWLESGELEYLGRDDQQIKIRGYRVELEEIESVLMTQPNIQHALVQVKESGRDACLVAYVVPENMQAFDEAMLQANLQKSLASYQLPHHFVTLPALPLTANGKMDLAALPEVDLQARDDYVAPRNEIEAGLCAIWSELLDGEPVSVFDDFFKLGGNSIHAVRMAAKVRDELSLDFSLAKLFEHKTIASLAANLMQSDEIVIPSLGEKRDHYPLSFAQERLFYIEQLQPSSAYHIPLLLALNEDVALEQLQQSVMQLVDRHPILRTRYLTNESGHVVQQVMANTLTIANHDCSADALAVSVQKQVDTPFDLEREVMRASFYNTGEQRYLLIVWHHIAFDGWSTSLFLKELAEHYHNGINGVPCTSPTWPIDYIDYSVWQRDYLQGDTLETYRTYWQTQLQDVETLSLPLDHNRPAVARHQGRELYTNIDSGTSKALVALAKENDSSLNSVLLSAFYLTLAHLCDQQDIIVGTPSDNRHHHQTQGVIGFFVNTLPLRMQVDWSMSTSQFIQNVHQCVGQAKAHQELPFEQIVELLGVERDASRHPLFQVVFGLQDLQDVVDDVVALPMTPAPLDGDVDFCPAKFDLSLMATRSQEGINITLNYAVSLFEHNTIEAISELYTNILVGLIDARTHTVGEIPLMSDVKQQELLQQSIMLREEFASTDTLVSAFEAQVATCPQAIALTCGQQQLSYQALNERANQLANWLRASYQAHYGQPLAANTLIALYVEPSLELMISVLAVLKAGAAYVPMAPSNPALRNQHVLDDSAPALVLTTAQSQSAYQTQLNSEAPLLVMDDDAVSACATTTPGVMHGADDLAYVIYTSGTTGKAKGVLQNHANVMRLFKATAADYQFNAQDVWMLYHAYTFDFTVWEMWGALLHGGRLVIPEQSLVRDFAAVAKLCQQEAVTVLNQTPGAFLGFAEAALTLELDFPALRYVIFGGDKLNPASLKRWWARFGDSQPQLVNMYGITETTVHTTYQPLYAEHASECSTIGRVLRDMQAYVLNEQMQLVPPGVPGELYIGGAGLSPGYLNRPELTAERFIDNPFADESMQALGYTRMYKTGDVVRWLADGTLEYLGRNDNQVKIRGYRIELGEIEAALLQQDGVQQAALLIDDSEGHARLLAYVVSDDAQLGATLKGALAHVLPSYMIPAHITVLAQLPLTVNGKLDRAALPRPSQVEARTYIAPSTKTEQILCSVWQEVLQVEQVGVNDNYYELGGDSIISIKLVTRARQAGVEFSLADLLATQTVSLLAQCVDAGEAKVQQTVASSAFSLISEADKALLPEGIEDAYPVSRLQLGMLYHTQASAGSLYHDLISYSFTLPLDESCLRDTLAAICARHSILRTQIALSGFSEPLQLVHEQAQIELFIGNTEEDLQAVHAWYKQEHQRGFADNEYPLLRVAAHRIDAERFHLSFSVHHAIIDGWSEAALTAEVAALYGKALAGKSLVQPALAASYRDFIAQEQAALSDTDNHTFWRNQFEQVAAQPVLLAPSDDDSLPSHTAPESDYLMFSFNATQAKALQALAARCDVSLKAVMFAAHSKALSLATGYEQVVSGLSVHGRPEVLDSDKLLGLFVNILPVTVSCQVGPHRTGSWLEFIQAVHGQMNAVEAQRFFPLEVVKELVGDEPFHAAFNYTSFNAYWQQDSVAAEDLLAGRMGIAENSLPLSLNVQTSQNTDEIMCSLSTLRSHYKAGVGVSYAKLYQRIIEMMLQDATASHHQVLEEAEQYQQLVQWNGHTVSFGEQTITELFEQHAARTPDAVALITQEKTYSYGELNAMANRRAAMILANVAGKPQMIGVYHSSRLDMVLSMLAALKVGAAYVPFAMGTPMSRLVYIIDDCQLSLVLSDSAQNDVLDDALSQSISKPVCMNVDVFDSAQYSADNLHVNSTLDDLAYIMYTSGTTGKPKGAMVTQRGVVSLVNNTDYVDITTQDVFVQLANPAFDAATFEIWGALTQGASLVIPNSDMALDAFEIEALLSRNQVSIVLLTRALFDSIYSQSPDMFSALRYLMVGGEALTPAIMNRLVSQPTRPKHILNCYGPTESTTIASTYECQVTEGSVPIGKPANGRQVYVLSPSRSLLPVGCVGELYISGAGLARGYLNKPALTEQAFIRGSEFQIAGIEPDAVLYKTGDKVRWLESGELEYLGRDDKQVKIRGYRIELEEIESVLMAQDNVQHALVQVKTRGKDASLVAYIVAQDAERWDELAFEEALKSQLASYQLPSHWVLLDKLPLTANGKADLAALPEVDLQARAEYVEPRNEIEATLCDIWSALLNVEQVSVYDDFFKLGGNSIHAVRMAAKVRDELALEFSLAKLFEHKTIASLAENLAQTDEIRIPSSVPRQARYPLSFAQEQMLLLERLPESQGSYQVPVFTKLNRNIDTQKLVLAIDAVISRHEVLRSTFNFDEDGESYQTPLTKGAEIQTVAVHTEQLNTFVSQQVANKFELDKSPAMRGFIINTEYDSYLLVVWHHIIFDGWSSGLFFSEVEQYYRSQGVELSPLSIQYADYALWQREYMQGDVLASHQKYWQQQVQEVEVLSIPTDYTRPAIPSFVGAEESRFVADELATELKALAAANSTTMYSVLMSAYFITLSRLSGQSDIMIGTPMDNRALAQTQSLIGYFVNSVPMRCKLDNDMTVSELVRQVHHLNVEAKRYQMLPFEQIVGLANTARDASRHPLYQVFFTLNQFADANEAEQGSECFAPDLNEKVLDYTPAKFDLTLDVSMVHEQLEISLNYATDLFSRQSAANMLEIYHRVLQQMCQAQFKRCTDLKLAAPSQMQLESEYLAQQVQCTATLAEQFKALAAKQPDAIAIESDEITLTYKQLDERSDALATHICQQFSHRGRLPEGTCIALYFNSGLHAIVAKMAVLKAGAAYVPISTKLPQARVQYILQDIAAKVVLTQSALEQEIQKQGIDTINLDATSCYAVSAPLEVGNPKDLAYVIYTSGTTGQPKGVMIEHASMSNLAHHNKHGYRLQRNEKFAVIIENYAFDTTAGLIFTALLNGASLVVIDDNTTIEHAIHQYGITHLDTTASVLQMLDESALEKLSRIVSGGEVTPISFAKRWSHKLINEYGPTETTVGSHQYHCSSLSDRASSVSIGKVVSNLRCYVLDDELNMLPVGCPGTLYISGIGLSRGYLNQPELTQEKFINNPFVAAGDGIEYQRMYCTGDKVLQNTSGEFMFVGREDEQVQLNGARVELGEIVAQINSLSGVQQSAVIVSDSGDAQLVAYVVPKADFALDKEMVINALLTILPAYMVPRHIYILDKLPLTTNGKLDKRALPVPSALEHRAEYCPPSTFVEEQLAEIWAEVLEIEATTISVIEDFFNLGGSSLKAVKVVRLIEKKLAIKLSIDFVLRHSSIRKMALELANEPQDSSVVLPLSQVQESECTLVLFHPVGGGAYCYRELLESLSPTSTVLGVQHPEFAGESGWLDASIEQLSDYYAQSLLARSVVQPIRMLGWSMGGVIAFAVAQKLIAKGYAVEWVGLVDSYVTSEFISPNSDTPMVQDAAHMSNTEERVLHANQQALDSYIPTGSVPQIFGVFVEQSKTHPVLSKAIERWAQRSDQPFKCAYVDGDHFSIMAYPRVTSLAQSLTELVNNIESKIN
ncbi:hypothetical protein PA25_30500 [Pseudoalteromonas sp. A25]|nr:hypothetical protein PA25_30500 [Pseudoalteromonas sp. A25]